MLIELVVSMAVSAILVSSGSALMIYMFKKQSEQLKIAGMQTDVTPAFDIMTRRISMAGTWAGAHDGTPYNYSGAPTPPATGANPFTLASWDLRVDNGNSCLLFSYDRNRDGIATEDERVGYRLSNGLLEEGAGALACNYGNWAALTHGRAVTVTSLQFIISTQAVSPSFNRRAVHIMMRVKPTNATNPVVLLKRTVRVRNDRAN